MLAACSGKSPPPEVAEPSADPQQVASTCGDRGYLHVLLTGALQATIDWPDDALRCQGMPRPDDRGVRLRFSGAVSGENLAIILAIPDLEPGVAANGMDTVVTMTVEGSGRFFSTPNLGACWTDVAVNEALPDTPDTYIVAGSVTCVGPLGEFNGDAFVEIGDLAFSGIAAWRGS